MHLLRKQVRKKSINELEKGKNVVVNKNSKPSKESSGRECSYKDFASCKPMSFSGTEGAVGLLQWIEKAESVFRMYECAESSKVKFATGTLLGGALTWWNSHTNTIGITTAYDTPWEEVKELMKSEYCPRNEDRGRLTSQRKIHLKDDRRSQGFSFLIHFIKFGQRVPLR